MTLTNDTISGNKPSGSGGGIDNNGGTLALGNTIVAANTAVGTTSDINGGITTDSGNNLLGTAVNNATHDPAPGKGDVFSDKPGLAGLGNYGGPTQTLDPLAGSPPIGAGNAAAANLPTADQRGLPRLAHGSLDIGAFQTQPQAIVFNSLSETTDAGQPTGPITIELQDLDGNPVSAGVSYSGNGTTADASGTSNLTLVGGAGFAAGQTGQALSLSGASQYAITPNLASQFANGDASVTVSLWFR